MNRALAPTRSSNQIRRPDISRLWNILLTEVVDENDLLGRDFLHFRKGTRISEAFDWFLIANMELDGLEPPVVEIRVKGWFRTRTWTYPGRVVTFRHGKARIDGVEHPELHGRTIVGVRWTSGSGHVETQVTDRTESIAEGGRYIRLRGMINGVHTETVV